MEHVKVRVLEEKIEQYRKQIDILTRARDNLTVELMRLRPAASFYLAMQETILRHHESLGPAWEEFCALLMLHSSEEDVARYEKIKRDQQALNLRPHSWYLE